MAGGRYLPLLRLSSGPTEVWFALLEGAEGFRRPLVVKVVRAGPSSEQARRDLMRERSSAARSRTRTSRKSSSSSRRTAPSRSRSSTCRRVYTEDMLARHGDNVSKAARAAGVAAATSSGSRANSRRSARGAMFGRHARSIAWIESHAGQPPPRVELEMQRAVGRARELEVRPAVAVGVDLAVEVDAGERRLAESVQTMG